MIAVLGTGDYTGTAADHGQREAVLAGENHAAGDAREAAVRAVHVSTVHRRMRAAMTTVALSAPPWSGPAGFS